MIFLDTSRDIFSQQKTIFGWPEWVSVTSKTAAARGAPHLVPVLSSRKGGQAEMQVELMDVKGLRLEHARLRLKAWVEADTEDFTATFEIRHAGKWSCIARLDIAPMKSHANIHWRRFGLNPQVTGSHIHGFEDNARLGEEGFRNNLPNATALPEQPRVFRDIMLCVETYFHVSGASDLRPPTWERMLL